MIDETNKIDVSNLNFGDKIIGTEIMWGHLFVETEDYVFLIQRRKFRPFIRWLGLFKVKFVLKK